MKRARRANQWLPFIVIGIFVIWYLSPLASYRQHMASYPGDPFAHAAGLGWFCNHFYRANHHIDFLFAPHGINGAATYDHPLLSTLTCLVSPAGIVAQFNLLTAIQVVLIAVISLWAANKFIHNRWLQVAFVFLYGFSTFFIAKAHQYINLLSLIWAVPLAFTLFWQLDPISRKSTLKAFMVLPLMFLSAWLTIPIITPLVVILWLRAVNRVPSKFRHNALKNSLLGTILAILLFLPLALPLIQSLSNWQPAFDAQRSYAYNADLVSYLIPWKDHVLFPIFNSWYQQIALTKGHYFEQFISLDVLIITALVIGRSQKLNIRTSELTRTLLIIAGFYALLSFGPYISVVGHKIITNPAYPLISGWPVFSINRSPSRYGIVVIFSLTMLAIQKIKLYLDTKPEKFKNSAAVLIAVYSLLAVSYLSQVPQIPHFTLPDKIPFNTLNKIKNNSQAGKVLHLPIAVQSDQSQNFLQWYHGRPIPSGLVSYLAQKPETLAHLNSDPLLSHLSCSHNILAFDRNQLSSYILDSGHPDGDVLTAHLQSQGFSHLIINQVYLSQPECRRLQYFINQSINGTTKLELLNDTGYFAVYEIN